MNPIAIAFAVAVPAAFVAGVIVHAYVISQAEKLKAHVSAAVDAAEGRIKAEVASVRSDVSSALSKVAAKV